MTLIPANVHAIAIRLLPGEDLKAALDSIVISKQLSAAFVMTCVGSLNEVVIRYANQQQTDTLTGFYEIVSLTGTLGASGSHLHIAVSNKNGHTIGGHVKEGCTIYTTAEIVLGIMTDVTFERTVDNNTGFKELVINRNT